MRIIIRGKNLEITQALRTYIDTKILKPVQKLLKGVAETELPILDLEFSRTTRHHLKGRVYYAEANLSIGKTRLRASIDEEDIRVACDLLEEELRRIIMRFKGRSIALERRGARRIKRAIHLSGTANLKPGKRTLDEGI